MTRYAVQINKRPVGSSSLCPVPSYNSSPWTGAGHLPVLTWPSAADPTARSCGVPIVDGFLAPTACPAHEDVGLGQLVTSERACGDAEPAGRFGHAEIPASHGRRPEASPNPPAAKPKIPAEIGFQKARARLYEPKASATHPDVLNLFINDCRWTSLEDRGFRFLRVTGTLMSCHIFQFWKMAISAATAETTEAMELIAVQMLSAGFLLSDDHYYNDKLSKVSSEAIKISARRHLAGSWHRHPPLASR